MVVIDMKMPTNCIECPFSFFDTNSGHEWYCCAVLDWKGKSKEIDAHQDTVDEKCPMYELLPVERKTEP